MSIESMDYTTLSEEEIESKIHLASFRNPPQLLVLKMLGVNNETDMDKVIDLGALISTIIDNPEEKEIRSLIIQKQFELAAELIFKRLNECVVAQKP